MAKPYFMPLGNGVFDEENARNQMIQLNEFTPVTDAVLEKHIITKSETPVFDIHTHFGRLCLGDEYEKLYDTGTIVEQLRSQGVFKVVNLDAEWGAAFDRMRRKLEGFEDFIINFGTLDVEKFEQPDFDKMVYSTIKFLAENGVRGLKFWKNIGLGIKDKNGKYLRLDDARLNVIWKTASEFKLPILIHVADPPSFFKPIDKNNERLEELIEHPDWSYLLPGMPSFEELMDMFEKILSENPDTIFIGAHAGIYAEDLAKVGYWLDNYPNFYADTADRLNELGRKPYQSRKFLQKYQDRIFLGTDVFWPNIMVYDNYYRFFETFDEYYDYSHKEIPPQGRWKIYSVGLEKEALEKIYYKNALKLFGMELSR